MKGTLVAAIGICLISISGQISERPLEGCADPGTIRMELAKLHQMDWRTLSLDRLRAEWPGEIEGKECDPTGCREVWKRDRIIGGHCECCTVWSFRIQGTAASPRTEWLDNLIINYAVTQRARAVEVTREFAAALGASAADVQQINAESEQTLHWETSSPRGRELSALAVRIEQSGNKWEIYLNSAQNIPK